MKLKSIVSAILMAGTFGAVAATVTQEGMLFELVDASSSTKSNKINNPESRKVKTKFNILKNKLGQEKYFRENRHEGTKRYIVRLIDDSVATYKGDIIGLEKTNISALKSGFKNPKFNAKSQESQKYITYLESKQSSFVQKASSKVGISIPKIRSYKFAINGLLTELTMDQAQTISKMPEVAFIEQDVLIELNTDTGPLLIGANSVWDGSATGSELMGEGITIGVIDTGINTDHRSFAATGDDGYTVVNPNGDGVYFGDCITDATLCNSKLIGVHSYSDVTDAYSDPIFAGDTRPANGEDYNGHGSHTSSTAGGNVLIDVPNVVTDIFGGSTGDGIETGYTFGRMSGVAPHANVISYQVCLPGDSGDTYAGCVFSAILAAIDDAITEDVDVINYSIGGSVPFSPWNSSIELGYLSAQAAGIFVATSAGNDGSAPSTTTKASPWYTAVAASNHGNSVVVGSDDGKTIGSFAGGNTAPPTEIIGGGSNAGFTGDIVYAGDFVNPNDAAGDSAQCLEPFPSGTFTATQIVVCDRGAIARTAKAENASAGGAGGFVLANLQGGAENIAQDNYYVPGIQISADDGDALKLWIASGTGHVGTIGSGSEIRTTNTADQIANFTSRGPNEFVELITPQIAAPGVNVYAAWSDDQPFMDGNGPQASDFRFLSGTSMASPHLAGTAALMTQARPTWNPDQIRSALMMTAQTNMLKEDGITPANPFDVGAGRVQVDIAVNAGLVMSESAANYSNADPATGGDPKTLNTPSMADFGCSGSCSWTRAFTIATDGSYALTGSSDALTMSPVSIEGVVGDTINVVFTLDVLANSTDSNVFESVLITSAGKPDLHLPVFALVNNGAVPEDIVITAGRNNGSWFVKGIQTVPTDELNFVIDGLFDNNAVGLSETVDFDIEQDSNTNPIDDFNDVFTYAFSVPANTVSLNAAITESTSPDNDLFILMDSTGDGVYNSVVAQAASLETNESANIDAPAEGEYLVIVQNFTASAAGASDTGKLTVNVVPQTDPVAGLSVSAPTSANGDVDVKLLWDLAMVPGDSYNADITVRAGTTEIGTFTATLNRVENDFSTTVVQSIVTRGEQIDYTLMVTPNMYNQAVSYGVSVDMPENMSLVMDSAIANGGNITVKDPNAVGLDLSSEFSITQDPTLNGDNYRDDLADVHVFEFDIPDGTLSMTVSISDSTSPDNDLFIEFDSDGDGTFSTTIARVETAATDEFTTIASPAAGRYRAIVQNFDDSSDGASDTGILSVTTVPATGEGFIWSLNVGAFLPQYTVVNAVNSGICAAAGLGGFAGTGGYTPLSAFGIGTIGVSGDEITVPMFGDKIYNFFGEDKTGLSVSDNGFVQFTGEAGDFAFSNTPLPTPSEPNDIIAGLWKDQIIEDTGNRGIRTANLGPISIIDFDGLEPWTAAGNSNERYFYQVQVMSDGVSDDHNGLGPYEIIISFSDTQLGSIGGATVGVENIDGTIGFDMSSLLEEGGQLCIDYNAPTQAFEVTFSVVPNAEFRGLNAAPTVTIESTMEGTQELVMAAAPVDLVNVGPIANAGEDITYDRLSTSEVTLNGVASLDLDIDRLSYKWSQTNGKSVGLRGPNAQQAFFNVENVPNGTYGFSLIVSDGELTSTDQVTITIIGDDGKTNGVGSMGMLLMFLVGSLFTRRRFSK